jgi:hypothetical protein
VENLRISEEETIAAEEVSWKNNRADGQPSMGVFSTKIQDYIFSYLKPFEVKPFLYSQATHRSAKAHLWNHLGFRVQHSRYTNINNQNVHGLRQAGYQARLDAFCEFIITGAASLVAGLVRDITFDAPEVRCSDPEFSQSAYAVPRAWQPHRMSKMLARLPRPRSVRC